MKTIKNIKNIFGGITQPAPTYGSFHDLSDTVKQQLGKLAINYGTLCDHIAIAKINALKSSPSTKFDNALADCRKNEQALTNMLLANMPVDVNPCDVSPCNDDDYYFEDYYGG